MFPEDFVKRIKLQHYLDSELLQRSLVEGPVTSVRVNTGKWNALPAGYSRVPWEENGYFLPERPYFTGDPLFHAGVYYPQESSSMFTGEAFRQVVPPGGNIRVLDLCGAPGGKSTHLSSLIGDNGFLVSNEVIRSRAAVLAENVTKWGLGNTFVTQSDPSSFTHLEGFFDVMVVDAPCSGEGMMNEAAVSDEWSLKNAALCSERQRRILMDSWPALRAGGVLIYSTCTFNPAENEENVAWLSETTGAQSIRIDISQFDGISEISYRNITGYGFYPGKIPGNGFFIAALRKAGESDGALIRDEKAYQKGLKSIPGKVRSLGDFPLQNLVFRGNRYISLAAGVPVYEILNRQLKVIKAGTLLGEFKKEDFIPAHDLAMSVRADKGKWDSYEMTYEEAVSYLSHTQMKLSLPGEGRLMMLYRGVPLGFANKVGSRLNNNYPVGWRIRSEKRSPGAQIL